jgi:hypothetical protein
MTLLSALGLAGVLFLVLRESRPVAQENPASAQGTEANAAKVEEKDPQPDPEEQVVVTQAVAAVELPATMPAPPPAVRCSSSELMAVLPLWMREDADVDAYADERVVAGSRVTRVRGRYAWPNGSLMEVEISDLGEAPSDLLLRSMGCNTALDDTVTDEGFSLNVVVMNEPATFEYDYGTGDGSLQVLVADRFLVEVQLELLPTESFETVIQHQVPLAALEEMAAKDRNPPH